MMVHCVICIDEDASNPEAEACLQAIDKVHIFSTQEKANAFVISHPGYCVSYDYRVDHHDQGPERLQ